MRNSSLYFYFFLSMKVTEIFLIFFVLIFSNNIFELQTLTIFVDLMVFPDTSLLLNLLKKLSPLK